MPWWIMFVVASIFFGIVAVISSKNLNTTVDFFRFQLYILPFVYLINVWYSKTFHDTYQLSIPPICCKHGNC